MLLAEAQQMFRQPRKRIQGASDDDFCKEGVSSTFTTFTSSEFLDDTPTTAFGSPSTAFTKGFVCVTGPFSIGDHLGHQNQTFLLTSGNLACDRSPGDPSKWHGRQLGTSERLVLQADDQRLYHQDRLSRFDPDTMRLIRLSQHIEYYLNGPHSLYYHDNHTIETLVAMLKILHVDDGLHKHLERIPESVALVRCDIPFYNPLKPERKEIIEQVVVEHYRSPWTKKWACRVRVAQVQNPHLWFLSLANGAENSDESFFDGYISINHETQTFQATTAPIVAAVTSVAADLPPGFGASTDVDIQPTVTPAFLSALPSTSFCPPGVSEFVSLAQPHLSVTTQVSLDTSDPSLGTTDLDTTQHHGGIVSPDDNDNTFGQPFTTTKVRGKAIKSFSCPYPGCFLSFTKKGNQKTHTIKHYEKFHCPSCQCAFSQKTDLDRHDQKVHLGWRWKCNHCSRSFTRESVAGNHTRCHANGQPPAVEKVTLPPEVCRQCRPPEDHQSRPKRQRQQCKQH
ncbi:hypothetical protein KI688_003654 [Linnemannia hyalina]|uniref:C2H2-type domain-containing protein n=1 Tax=Linnemannia hyalina TaxID=64524 RepID=A0A9P8BQ22_9FUNG|nr:hypothetical protein KI688_003654 [Linnemannia hyalina]